MRVSMLCEFGLKIPTPAPFGGVFGVKWENTETFFGFIPPRMQ